MKSLNSVGSLKHLTPDEALCSIIFFLLLILSLVDILIGVSGTILDMLLECAITQTNINYFLVLIMKKGLH